MKPHRIRMTHNLLLNYGLYRKMEIYRPHKATQEEITKFHSDDYIRFLRSIRPDNMSEYNKQMQRFNVGEVCKGFSVYDQEFDQNYRVTTKVVTNLPLTPKQVLHLSTA